MANYDLTYEGSEVQGILNTGNSLKDAGYIFRGEATPSTVPGTPTERVAYIGGPGTYTNFGDSITVPAGCVCIFKYNGSAWTNQVIDAQGASEGIFDLSAYNAQGDTLATYADLSAALTALNALPSDFKKGGMSLKFVLSSDNKYVKYFCNSQNFTTDITQWQGVDEEPTEGSKSLVVSGSLYSKFTDINRRFGVSEIIDLYKEQLNEGYVSTSGIQSGSYHYLHINLTGKRAKTITMGSGDVGIYATPFVLDDEFNIIIQGVQSGGTYNIENVTGIYINLYGNTYPHEFTLTYEENYEKTPDYLGYKNRGFINKTTGEFNAATSGAWWTTDYIPVSVGEVVSVTCNSANSDLAAFYDAEKNYLPDVSIVDGTEYETRQITVPSGAAFMRSSGYSNESTEKITFITRKPVREICSENAKTLDSIVENVVEALENIYPQSSKDISAADFSFADFIYYVDGKAAANSSYHCTDFISVEGFDMLAVNLECEYLACCAFYTAADEAHYTGIHFVTSSTNREKVVHIPYGVKYVRLSNKNTYTTPSARLYKAKCFFDGMKAAIYGTSIEAGYGKVTGEATRAYLLDVFSYVSAACVKCGITPINYAVPSGCLTGSGDLAFIDDTTTINYNGVNGSICGVNYQNAMLDLIGTVNEPDIFIFVFGHNDEGRKQYCHLEDSDVQDYSSLDTDTFVGAYNFVLKKLFEAKPTAKVIILTHFSDDKATHTYNPETWGSEPKVMKYTNDVVENIAAYWNVPCIPMRHKVDFIANGFINNVSSYLQDQVHVANYAPTNDVPVLLERLSYILAKELEKLA